MAAYRGDNNGRTLVRMAKRWPLLLTACNRCLISQFFSYNYSGALITGRLIEGGHLMEVCRSVLLTLQVPIVTNVNFLLTISIQCQEIRL